MGDLLLAQNNTICMLGNGESVRSGDRAPAKINTPCVFVREGENKYLHSLILHLCVIYCLHQLNLHVCCEGDRHSL